MMQLIRRAKTTAFFLLFLTIPTLVWAQAKADTIPAATPAARLQGEILRFTEIERAGGWPRLTVPKKQYRRGESAPAIRQLKKRLQVGGTLAVNDTSSVFTAELEAAVKKAQQQFGFSPTGILEASLVKALNVPVERRLQQLLVNANRLQGLGADTAKRRLVINIPEYKLHLYENGRHLFELKVVVGKESSRTAVFDDELTHIVFSPYWNVPPSIVQKEILPAMRRRKNYLAANGYEITGRENGLPVIRQKPGRNNALGQVKFLFPNEHAIYLHDTPAKSLFKNRIRAYSHGCIRLEDPARLAEYLLQSETGWPTEKIAAAMNSGKEQWVRLRNPVPVSITYLTAWVDENNELNFRDDIYGLD